MNQTLRNMNSPERAKSYRGDEGLINHLYNTDYMQIIKTRIICVLLVITQHFKLNHKGHKEKPTQSTQLV